MTQVAEQVVLGLNNLPSEGRLRFNDDFSELQGSQAPWPIVAREVDPAIGPTLAAAPSQLRAALLLLNCVVARLQAAMQAPSQEEAARHAMGGTDQLWEACRELRLTLDEMSVFTSLIGDVAALRGLGLVALRLHQNANNQAAWEALYEALMDAGLMDEEPADTQ